MIDSWANLPGDYPELGKPMPFFTDIGD